MTEKTLVIYNCSDIETIEETTGKKKSSYKEEVHYLRISGDIESRKIVCLCTVQRRMEIITFWMALRQTS